MIEQLLKGKNVTCIEDMGIKDYISQHYPKAKQNKSYLMVLVNGHGKHGVEIFLGEVNVELAALSYQDLQDFFFNIIHEEFYFRTIDRIKEYANSTPDKPSKWNKKLEMILSGTWGIQYVTKGKNYDDLYAEVTVENVSITEDGYALFDMKNMKLNMDYAKPYGEEFLRYWEDKNEFFNAK